MVLLPYDCDWLKMVELSLYAMYNRRNLKGLDFRPCVLLTKHTQCIQYDKFLISNIPSSLKCWSRCYKWDSLSLLNRFSKSYPLGCFSVFPPIHFYQFYSFSIFFKFFKNSFCVLLTSLPQFGNSLKELRNDNKAWGSFPDI